jgi:hypothetical protein
MKNSKHNLKTIVVVLMALMVVMLSAQAAAILSDKDKQFLAGYEKVRAALAADDLTAAKTAAKDLGADGSDVANAASLKDARAAFEKLSNRATALAVDQSGYYVAHCPMVNKDWVQTTEKISNPYGGKEMLTCGTIKK